jgi:hypothetical protein
MYLRKAFQSMKFFQEHETILSPEIYEMLFQKIMYVRRSAFDILFHYG